VIGIRSSSPSSTHWASIGTYSPSLDVCSLESRSGAEIASRTVEKQSKPLPNVLSSISFQKAGSHGGGAVHFMGSVASCSFS